MVIHAGNTDDDFPYPTKVRLIAKLTNGEEFVGSGVYVSPDIVLTAAHVLRSPNYTERLWSIDFSHGSHIKDRLLNVTLTGLNSTSKFKEHVRILEPFDHRTGEADAAIIKLVHPTESSELTIAEFAPKEIGTIQPNSHLGVNGWGDIHNGFRYGPTSIAQHAAQLVSAEKVGLGEDQSKYYSPDGSEITFSQALDRDLFFISSIRESDNRRIGPCPGDSGGGIFVGSTAAGAANPQHGATEHLLIGLVSHGSKPAPPKTAPNDEKYDHYSDPGMTVGCVNLTKFHPEIKAAISDLGGQPAGSLG